MSYEKAKALLNKYKTGTCNDAEKAIVENWLFNFQNGEIDLSAQTIDEIGNEILSKLPLQYAKEKRRTIWPQRIAVAASIILCLGIGLYFFVIRNKNIDETQFAKINPGSNKAYLTLANGQKITLNDVSNGTLAEQTGVQITKTGNGQLVYENKTSGSGNRTESNTIETPRGGQYQINLPDGTKVWLNAASKLKFPVTFAHLKERRVELTGEAYFEVKHDAEQPFRVQTAGQVVEDIGTAFNVNSYADETTTKTTLLEGSARVISTNLAKGNDVILKPGQQANLTKSGKINITPVDMETVLDWKNGEFMLKNDNIKSIMRKISRWYNVEIEFQDDQVDKETFSGSVSRYGNVSEILKTLELTDKVHFKMEGKKIIVMK